jgi:hypothetical protein
MSDKSDKQYELLWNTARRIGISRRDFLKLLATGGISAFLAACFPGAGQMVPTDTGTHTQTSTFPPPSTSTPITPSPTQVNPSTTPPLPKSITQRIGDRLFPSVFMAWQLADNFNLSFDKNAAHYDLVITNEWQFELWWESTYPGQGISFQPSRIEIGRTIHDKLLGNNPNIVVMGEVRYRDAASDWLPEDSPWWERDSSGKRVPGWGNYYMLDWHIPSSWNRVAAQAKAFVDSGIFDGVMLDWWDDSDPDRIKMLEEVRNVIGSDKLIIANSNSNKALNSAPYLNGLYMEAAFGPNGAPATPHDWQTISNTLLWAEESLLEPHINALETWYVNTPSEFNRLRATTTLALTHSNGYALFANNNHNHVWNAFWDHKELGKPIAKMTKRPDGAIQREFDGGTVIYNPMGNATVTVKFIEPRLSAARGQTALTFVLEAMDGDLYLKTA